MLSKASKAFEDFGFVGAGMADAIFERVGEGDCGDSRGAKDDVSAGVAGSGDQASEGLPGRILSRTEGVACGPTETQAATFAMLASRLPQTPIL